MPIVKVWCLPADRLEEVHLARLTNALQESVSSVSELGLPNGSTATTILYPSDLMKAGLGEEVIAEVVGLFVKPERTDEVRSKLAQ